MLSLITVETCAYVVSFIECYIVHPSIFHFIEVYPVFCESYHQVLVLRLGIFPCKFYVPFYYGSSYLISLYWVFAIDVKGGALPYI